MTNTSTIRPTTAERLARAQDAAEHANSAVRPDWTLEAARWLYLHAASSDVPVLVEEARTWAESLGFELPPDGRAWGGVARAAKKMGLVKPAGYRPAHDGSPKTAWVVA